MMCEYSGLSESDAFQKARDDIEAGRDIHRGVEKMLELAFQASQPQLRR